MKQTKHPKLTMFPPKIGHARKEYVCDGCQEIPITKGSVMATVVAKLNGTFTRSHYCIRCILAIEAKKLHRKDHTVFVTPGSLKLSLLSNPFRKSWLDYVCNLKAMPHASHEDVRNLSDDLFAAIGLDYKNFLKG